jgi:hypothetical protein
VHDAHDSSLLAPEAAVPPDTIGIGLMQPELDGDAQPKRAAG